MGFWGLTFESMVKFSGPIPGFVQEGIKSLVNDIAVKELSKYCEGGLESQMFRDFLHRPVVDWCEINCKRNRISNRFIAAPPAVLLENLKTWTNPKSFMIWMHHNMYKISNDVRQSTLGLLNIATHTTLIPKDTDASTKSFRKGKSTHQATSLSLFVQNLFLFPKLILQSNYNREAPTPFDVHQSLLNMANDDEEISKCR